ncbi:MAG TPA: ABC transporter permease [Prolixibacteraceae bacterium]|nr:ABC transporter permease [Prolixibacteraceae bacterium]
MYPSSKKIIRDLLSDKGRSFIVLLAIVLGAFGVSMMTTAYQILGRNLNDNYRKTNPAAFTLVVDTISDDLLQQARLLPGNEYVETRNKIMGRVETGNNELVPIWLFVVDDLSNVQINTYRLLSGKIPATGNEMLIERTGNRLTDIAEGKHYRVTIPGFGTTEMKISGIVHDPGQAPSWMEGLLYGYVSKSFVKSMHLTGISPELKFTIRTNSCDRPTIERQMAKTVSFLESNRIKIIRTEILTPGRHIHQSQMDSLMFLLQMFGVLALLLSCFLIINMIMAIMAKETRQIGVMKAIGATTRKITSIYIRIVFIFGIVATLIALPLGYLAGRGFAQFVASMLNFELFNQQVSHGVWAIQLAIGTVLPVLVAFAPIYRASRITVREALNDYGVSDTLSIKSEHSQQFIRKMGLSNITLLAIRNTFRRKGRLVLTLITLVLGGAVFISAFNIRTSLKDTVNSRFTNQHYDISMFLSEGVNEAVFCASLDCLPIVADYETWGYARATRIVPGKPESELMDVKVVPLQTHLFVPEIIDGKWLSGNAGEVVVNHVFLAKYPDVRLGNTITLKVNGQTQTLKVVGSIRELFSGPTVYVSKTILAQWPAMVGKTNSALISFKGDQTDLSANSAKLEQWFKANQYPVSLVFRKDQYKERVIDHLVVITSMLIMVTLLLILVGGLGLITTMGINMVERLRELSILRAIGVDTPKLYQLILTEGFLTGWMSWVIAVVASVPVSYYLGNKFFEIFFETTLNFDVSLTGILVWLAIIIVFSTIAVVVPARSANKRSIREGLSYE